MDYRLRWSPGSLRDLEEITSYIAYDSQFYANTVVKKIITIAEDLPLFPESGRIVPECKTKYLREKLIYNYRLIYQIVKKEILIMAVIHQRRLLNKISDRLGYAVH